MLRTFVYPQHLGCNVGVLNYLVIRVFVSQVLFCNILLILSKYVSNPQRYTSTSHGLLLVTVLWNGEIVRWEQH